MGAQKWIQGTSVQIADTNTVALANNGLAACTTGASPATYTFTNSSLDELKAFFQLMVNFSVAPTLGATIGLYGVPKGDGTNFATVDTVAPTAPVACLMGSFVVEKAATGVQYMPLSGVDLDPVDYQFYLFNTSGQSLPTGWTVQLTPFHYQY